MAVRLNRAALEHALSLLKKGKYVADERDAWNEHQPSSEDEDEFVRQHGLGEYARWHLGIDDEQGERTKGRYRFPFGDFARVHRCAVLSVEVRAGQYKYLDVERVAAHLRGMIDARVSPRAQR